MSWQATLAIIGVAVLGVAIAIIVLCVKLRSARRLADKRWVEAERTKRKMETLKDLTARLRHQAEIKELSNVDAINRLHGLLDAWSVDDGDG